MGFFKSKREKELDQMHDDLNRMFSLCKNTGRFYTGADKLAVQAMFFTKTLPGLTYMKQNRFSSVDTVLCAVYFIRNAVLSSPYSLDKEKVDAFMEDLMDHSIALISYYYGLTTDTVFQLLVDRFTIYDTAFDETEGGFVEKMDSVFFKFSLVLGVINKDGKAVLLKDPNFPIVIEDIFEMSAKEVQIKTFFRELQTFTSENVNASRKTIVLAQPGFSKTASEQSAANGARYLKYMDALVETIFETIRTAEYTPDNHILFANDHCLASTSVWLYIYLSYYGLNGKSLDKQWEYEDAFQKTFVMNCANAANFPEETIRQLVNLRKYMFKLYFCGAIEFDQTEYICKAIAIARYEAFYDKFYADDEINFENFDTLYPVTFKEVEKLFLEFDDGDIFENQIKPVLRIIRDDMNKLTKKDEERGRLNCGTPFIRAAERACEEAKEYFKQLQVKR